MSKILVGFLFIELLAFPCIMMLNHQMRLEAQTMELAATSLTKTLSYGLKIKKINISVQDTTLKVNKQKTENNRIEIKPYLINLNDKGVLTVDNGKDFPLIIYAQRAKSVPDTKRGKKIIIGKRTAYVSEWLETDCGRLRKFSCPLFFKDKGWLIEISQMGKEQIPQEFNEAVISLRWQ